MNMMNLNKAWAAKTICAFDSLPDAQNAPEHLISVCVTLFNYAEFLEDCLDSLKQQTHSRLDIVVIDDASQKDDSLAVARLWAEQNQTSFYRIRVHQHVRNQGPAEARNTAFRLAMGDYVFIIDADNQIYPRAIARLYDAMISGGFDATYSQIEKFGDHRAIGDADIWDIDEMRGHNYVDVMALVTKAAWAKIDGFSHIEDGWEDYDFWLKFIDAGFAAAYVPEILSRYRVHKKSRTATEAHSAHEDLRVLMAFRHEGFGAAQAELQRLEAAEAAALDDETADLPDAAG
jgi:glycosyltransferase involved in cell wall biosynthesis